jgi:hypothetical protein
MQYIDAVLNLANGVRAIAWHTIDILLSIIIQSILDAKTHMRRMRE